MLSLRRAAAALALIAVAVSYLSLANGTWLISPDSTDYVEGARSLARLEGFRDAGGAAETLVPPGASAVYALAAVLPASDYFYFNLLTKLLAIAFFVLTFLVVRRSDGPLVALLLVLFLALNEPIIFESTRILSDIPFSAVFMLTLWLFPEDELRTMSTAAGLALGAMAAICYLIRTPGLFVCLGYLTCIGLRAPTRRLKTIALVSGVFAVAAGALWLRSRIEGASYSYAQLVLLRRAWVTDSGFPGFADWYERLITNGVAILRNVYVMFANEPRLLPVPVVACMLMVVGLAYNLRRRQGLLYVCLLAWYVPVLLVPPFPPEPRYVVPILPLLALLVASGARAVMNAPIIGQRGWLVRTALAALIVLNPYWTSGWAFLVSQRADVRRMGGAAIVYRGHAPFIELVERRRGTLTPADAVMTMHANILRYFVPAGTRVMNMPLVDDRERLYRLLLDSATTVIYCDKASPNWQYLAPVIQAHADSFHLDAENQAAAIYRIRR